MLTAACRWVFGFGSVSGNGRAEKYDNLAKRGLFGMLIVWGGNSMWGCWDTDGAGLKHAMWLGGYMEDSWRIWSLYVCMYGHYICYLQLSDIAKVQNRVLLRELFCTSDVATSQ
jgi:hypothetical protein